MSWVDERTGPVVLADVRWYLDGRSGRAAYDAGHIPGAVFVDLDRWLAGEASPESGRHPLPEPETFAAGMSALGIGEDSRVVAYDDEGGVIAARLVWMLRVTGHEAALLDGGLQTYHGPLERDAPRSVKATFTPRPWPPHRLADIDDASDPANTVIDARAPERYRGDLEPVDARAGHIPGARNVACRANLDQAGRFLPAETLRHQFLAAGMTDGKSTISYCGSGVTACHNLIAMELAGFGGGRLYAGSWSQYSHASTRPVATGSAPGS